MSPRARRQAVLVLLSLLALGALGGCGKKADLELPGPPPPQTEQDTEVG